MIRSILRAGLLVALVFSSATFSSAATILNFTGLQNNEQVLNFYNGGTGSLGSSAYFNYGVAFAASAITLIDSDVGGTGNFANSPSPFAALFSSTSLLSFNVSSGFTEALTFFYVTYANADPASVKVYSGVNGTGTQLAAATLNPPNQLCPGDPTGSFFGCWQSVDLSFIGTGKSVVFSAAALQFGVDNLGLNLVPAGGVITLPVSSAPEPASLTLLGGALAGAWMLRKRLRA